MIPDEFDYHEPGTTAEVIELLAEYGDAGTELLAGGHSLLPAMKSGLSSPDVLIDISGIEELSGVTADGGTLTIGAMTSYSDVLGADEAHDHAPALTAAVEQVGDRQVRNRGTVGGNIAHADPASDLPGAVLASEATMVVQGPDGEREVPADEFYLGMYTTDIGPDELLTRIEIPSADGAVGTYAKRASPSSGYAMVGVAVLVAVEDGAVSSARVGASGVMDRGVRLEGVEDALVDEPLEEETIEVAAERAGEDLDTALMMDDLRASGEFRAQLLEVYAERALAEASNELPAPAAAD